MADEPTTANSSGGLGGNPSAAPGASPDGSRHQATTTADRPAYVPETFWDADRREVKSEAVFGELKKLSDERAAAEQRRASLPKDPKEYRFTPPEGFKLPEVDGKQAEIDPTHPMWNKLATFAHAEGLSPEQFSKAGALAIDLLTGNEVARAKAISDFKAAEEAKLGDNSKARIEALHRFVDANAGSAEGAAAVKASIANAPMAEFLEKAIGLLSSNGITAFNGSGRDQGPGDGKPSNWGQMSDVDRLAWARADQARRSNGAARQ